MVDTANITDVSKITTTITDVSKITSTDVSKNIAKPATSTGMSPLLLGLDLDKALEKERKWTEEKQHSSGDPNNRPDNKNNVPQSIIGETKRNLSSNSFNPPSNSSQAGSDENKTPYAKTLNNILPEDEESVFRGMGVMMSAMVIRALNLKLRTKKISLTRDTRSDGGKDQLKTRLKNHRQEVMDNQDEVFRALKKLAVSIIVHAETNYEYDNYSTKLETQTNLDAEIQSERFYAANRIKALKKRRHSGQDDAVDQLSFQMDLVIPSAIKTKESINFLLSNTSLSNAIKNRMEFENHSKPSTIHYLLARQRREESLFGPGDDSAEYTKCDKMTTPIKTKSVPIKASFDRSFFT